MAADALFESAGRKKKYKTYYGRKTGADLLIKPEKVRLCFDLLRELFASALAQCGAHHARIRISPFQTVAGEGFRFSNLTIRDEPFERTVQGHPYLSLDDVIFREGKSGLSKIASLSASIFGSEVDVVVKRKERSFHIFVLLWSSNVAVVEAVQNEIE